MSNTSGCNPRSSFHDVGRFACAGNTGPWGTDIFNVTTPTKPAANQTGQAVMDALIECCPSAVQPAGTDETSRCHSYCTTSGLEEAEKTNWCLGNYTAARPGYYFGILQCDTAVVSGATILGRSSGWGGLVVLGLVMSTVMTMM